MAKPAMWASLGLAVAGHAALLWSLTATGVPQAQGAPEGAAHSMRVQLLPAPAPTGAETRAAAGRAHQHVQPALAALQPGPAVPVPDSGYGEFGKYLSAAEVDRPALPRSSPDPGVLDDVVPSGLPIRLRLYISADGSVVQVEVLSASEDDGPVVDRLRKMFLATGFVAAIANGHEVPSYKDIDVNFSDVVLPSSVPAAMTAAAQS